jgi:hypothetical protein
MQKVQAAKKDSLDKYHLKFKKSHIWCYKEQNVILMIT